MSQTQQPQKSRSGVIRRLSIALLVCLATIFSLSVIVNIPAVQEWGLRQLTRYLSRETGSTVTVEAFSLDIFSQFTLRDVYISQYAHPSDTLIYAAEVGLKFSRLWKLFGSKPEIKELRLRSGRMYVGDVPIRLFTSKGRTRNNPGLQIRNPEILLEDIGLVVDRSEQPVRAEYQLPGAWFRIKSVDTDQKVLEIAEIALSSPTAWLELKPRLVRDTGMVDVFEAIDTAASPPFSWRFSLDKVSLSEGRFFYKSEPSQVHENAVDYTDLEVFDVEAQLNHIVFKDTVLSGELRDMRFSEKSGFTMDQISAGSFSVSPDGLAFGDLKLRTAGSVIADTLHISFGEAGSAEDPMDRLQIYARFADSRIAIADLLKTIPGLEGSEVFHRNREEVLHISGIIHGSPNRMRGDDLRIVLGNMFFTGKFRSRNLAIPGKQLLNLEVAQARFFPLDLERHIPGVKIQPQFGKLGMIQFTGRFDGFLNDFVAYGNVRTDIGKAEVDLNLKTTGSLTEYSGGLALHNFDLRKWTGMPEFGLVSASLQLRNGKGLTAETASANVEGTIRQFHLKGYRYSDITVNGHLEQDRFSGTLAIDDPNIEMEFEGTVSALRQVPVFDFTADIRNLNLHKLHLTQDTLSIAGMVTARGSGKDIRDIRGQLLASSVRINRGPDAQYALDTMDIDIDHLPEGERVVRVTSDFARGWVKGNFELRSVYPAIAHYLEETYPRYFSQLKYNQELSASKPAMTFDLVLNKPEAWGGLLNLNDVRFRDFHVSGLINLERDSVMVDVSSPDFHFKNLNIYRPELHITSIDGRAQAQTSIVAIDIDEQYFFDEISASIQMTEDGFTWSLAADDLLEELNTLDLSGQFTIDEDDVYTLHLDPKIIEVLDQSWTLQEGNVIRWGKDFIELRDIAFDNGEQRIVISDVNNRGVAIETRRFDFSFIDLIWDYEKLDFNGPYTLRAGVSDLFEMEDFYLAIDAPELLINGDSYGVLKVSAEMAEAGQPILVHAGLEHAGVHLAASGEFYPPMEEVQPDRRKTLDLDIRIDTFPVAFLEYFLRGSIENTVGQFVGQLRIHGSLDHTKMNGNAVVYQGATTVTYLGTRYFIDRQKVRMTETEIDLTGAVLTDEFGNTARIDGGLTHSALSRLGLDARISSPRILALNTTKADNSAYYGRGIGSVDAGFQGYVDRPTIIVNAVTSEGTSIVINLVDAGNDHSKSFIRFRDDEEVISGALNKRTNITGVNFEMNLTATPAAVVEIKLEESPPESIVGSGSGNIQLAISRTGDFSMYGEYQIERGDYLFRSFYIINKPFVLRRGGTIRWIGDPYNALIDIEADYTGLRASLSTFLAEYLINASTTAQAEAQRKHDVQLKLLLTGTLLQPEINFDLSFPELSGELAGYAETKLRTLRANQNAMNEQVFGLLWTGSFLPSNVLQTNSGLTLAQEGIWNSLTEFLSGQVSAFFSSVISRWVEDVDLISGIDFDVGYSPSTEFDYLDLDESPEYEEWEVRVKPRLLNDRVIIDAGGNYVTSSLDAGRYFVGDYALEYLLTQDGRLKIRFYYRQDPPTTTVQGRRDKFGIGLAWRREFDSFDEWLSGLKKKARELKDSPGQ